MASAADHTPAHSGDDQADTSPSDAPLQTDPPDFVRAALAGRAQTDAADPSASESAETGASSWRPVAVGPDDELPDILARIRGEQATRVCLVVSQDVLALQSMVALRALRSLAAAGQVTLGLAARDRALVDLARKAGWETPALSLRRPVVAPSGPPGRSEPSRADSHQQHSSGPVGMAQEGEQPPTNRRGAEPQFPSVEWLWRTIRRAWRSAEPAEALPPERPANAAAALAAASVSSSARLRGSRPALTLPPWDSGDAASRPGRWSVYQHATPRDEARAIPRLALRPWSRWQALLGAIALLLVAASAVWLLWPSAQVTLVTAPVAYQTEVALVADPGTRQLVAADSTVPADLIRVEEIEEREVPTTGQRAVPDGRAVGEVIFTNKQDRPVSVPKGTVVIAGPIRFATTADVAVPGTITQGEQQIIGMRRARIEAIAPGEAGTIGARAISRMDGALATSLDVSNDKATEGGTNRTISLVTAKDRQDVYDALFAELQERVQATMQDQVRSDRSLLIWPGQNPAIAEEVYDPPNAGDEASTLRLRLQLRYSATQFAGDDINRLLATLLAARVQETSPGWAIVDETLEVQPPQVESVEQPGGAVRLLIRVKGHIEPRIDRAQIRADLAGRTREEAQAYLANLQGFAATQLEVGPGWTEQLPRLGFRISVQSRRAAESD